MSATVQQQWQEHHSTYPNLTVISPQWDFQYEDLLCRGVEVSIASATFIARFYVGMRSIFLYCLYMYIILFQFKAERVWDPLHIFSQFYEIDWIKISKVIYLSEGCTLVLMPTFSFRKWGQAETWNGLWCCNLI